MTILHAHVLMLCTAASCHVISHLFVPPAPGDYMAIINQTVTFGPDDTQQSVTVNTVADGIFETIETFRGRLAPSDAQVSILQNTAEVDIVDTGGI